MVIGELLAALVRMLIQFRKFVLPRQRSAGQRGMGTGMDGRAGHRAQKI